MENLTKTDVDLIFKSLNRNEARLAVLMQMVAEIHSEVMKMPLDKVIADVNVKIENNQNVLNQITSEERLKGSK
ncbi:MAG: hypothetical protein EOP43_07620 [Sphingobacteriaceae bacterium]|nr:MAG: hypothetical protein EOP43_07620 [Sphingobacteriaceae bacterium]